MKLTLPLLRPIFDTDSINKEEIKENCQAFVFGDVHDLVVNNARGEEMIGETIFSLFIEYGKDFNKTLMFDVYLDDLEEFAAGILKNIEMVRRDYKNHIQKQIDAGCMV